MAVGEELLLAEFLVPMLDKSGKYG